MLVMWWSCDWSRWFLHNKHDRVIRIFEHWFGILCVACLDVGFLFLKDNIWAASSEFGTYHLCEQRRFRRACASPQSRQNRRCSLIQAVSQRELSDRKPDPWPLWMTGHVQLNLSWRNAQRHKFAWRGPYNVLRFISDNSFLVGGECWLTFDLTHICLANLSILISWTCLFPILGGVWCTFSFLFYFDISDRNSCNHTV